MMDSG